MWCCLCVSYGLLLLYQAQVECLQRLRPQLDPVLPGEVSSTGLAVQKHQHMLYAFLCVFHGFLRTARANWSVYSGCGRS
jgi:hypothetical protein